MKLAACAFVASFLAVPALAAEPPAPAGLDRLAQLLPGTWRTEGQTFDSPFTKAGPQRYTTQRDCWQGEGSYKCVSVVNGTLQLYAIFGWDAKDNLYHETQVTAQGKQPEFHVSVDGDTWTYGQDIARSDGSVVHYRIVRTYMSPASAAYSYAYSLDGKQWTEIAKGTETRL